MGEADCPIGLPVCLCCRCNSGEGQGGYAFQAWMSTASVALPPPATAAAFSTSAAATSWVLRRAAAGVQVSSWREAAWINPCMDATLPYTPAWGAPNRQFHCMRRQPAGRRRVLHERTAVRAGLSSWPAPRSISPIPPSTHAAAHPTHLARPSRRTARPTTRCQPAFATGSARGSSSRWLMQVLPTHCMPTPPRVEADLEVCVCRGTSPEQRSPRVALTRVAVKVRPAYKSHSGGVGEGHVMAGVEEGGGGGRHGSCIAWRPVPSRLFLYSPAAPSHPRKAFCCAPSQAGAGTQRRSGVRGS